MFIYSLLTRSNDADLSNRFHHVSVTAFVSFEQAATRLYDWYNGQTGDDGEIYHSEWREHQDKNRWFNPNFPQCEIRRNLFLQRIASAILILSPSLRSTRPMQPALPAAAMRMDHLDHRFTLSAVHIKSDRNRSEHDKSLQSLALVRVGAKQLRMALLSACPNHDSRGETFRSMSKIYRVRPGIQEHWCHIGCPARGPRRDPSSSIMRCSDRITDFRWACAGRCEPSM